MDKSLINRNPELFYHTFPVLAALICLGVFLVRASNVFHFDIPWHIVTTGCEEESLFALFKYVHHEAVYQNPHEIPYAASYFNWMFYGVYGQVIKLFAADDIWLPTIGRGVSFVLSFVAYLALFKWFKSICNSWLQAFVFSSFVIFGPLIGYWGLTVRPDLPAFVCEILAVVCFFHYRDSKPLVGLAGFVFACYFAWSFKQINVVMPGALGLYLLFTRQWRYLVYLCLGYFSLIGLTLLLAPEDMREALLFSDTAVTFYWYAWYLNFVEFSFKTFPVWLLLAVSLFSKSSRSFLLKDDLSRFALCGLLVWGIIMIPASAKVGSSTNYYFLGPLFASILVLRLLPTIKPWLNMGAWGLFVGMMCIILWQERIVLDLSHQHRYHLAIKECIDELPKPVYVKNLYASLPWMNNSKPHFVLAYNYFFDRKHDYEYEADGVGGLIKNEYFKSLILPTMYIDEFDQAPLSHYSQVKQCKDMNVYVLKDLSLRAQARP